MKNDANLEDALSHDQGVIAEVIDGSLYHRARYNILDIEHLWQRMMEALFVSAQSITGRVADVACQPTLELGASILHPEGALWFAGRDVHRWSPRAHVEVHTTAPDLVVEIVDDQTDGPVRDHKLPVYLRAGVGTVWLLDIWSRTFSVLVAGSGSYELHSAGREQGSLRLHPFSHELPLADYWDSYNQASDRKRDKVAELAAAMEKLSRKGISERDQVLLLLASLDVWPTIDDWGDGVGSWMLRSSSVVVRARMLMVLNVSLARALSLAREELEAERQVALLGRDGAEALCRRYCELYRQRGARDPEVLALKARAHAFARGEVFEFWWPRGDDGSALDHSVTEMLAAYRATGRDEARVFALLTDGLGHFRPAREDWQHALRAFIAQLPQAYGHEPELRNLLLELEELAKPVPRQEYERPPEAEEAEIYVEGHAGSLTSEEFRARIMEGARELRERTDDDVALRWDEGQRRRSHEDTDIDD